MPSNIQQFTATLDKWKVMIPKKQDAVVRNIMVAIAENVIVGGRYSPGTPVDTSRARNSWFVGLDQMPGNALASGLDHSGQLALSEAMGVLAGAKAGGIIYLVNGAAYIRRLEYGWSSQAPAGMVRITLSNAQELVDGVCKMMRSQGLL